MGDVNPVGHCGPGRLRDAAISRHITTDVAPEGHGGMETSTVTSPRHGPGCLRSSCTWVPKGDGDTGQRVTIDDLGTWSPCPHGCGHLGTWGHQPPHHCGPPCLRDMGCRPPWTWAPEGHGDAGHRVTVDMGMSAAMSPCPLLGSPSPPRCPQHLTSLLVPSQCPHPANVVPSITSSLMAPPTPMSPLAPTSPSHLLVPPSTRCPQGHRQPDVTTGPHVTFSPSGATIYPMSPRPPSTQCHHWPPQRLVSSWCHHLPDVPKATVNVMSPLAPTTPCQLLVPPSTRCPQGHRQPHATLSPPGATTHPTSSPVPPLAPRPSVPSLSP